MKENGNWCYPPSHGFSQIRTLLPMVPPGFEPKVRRTMGILLVATTLECAQGELNRRTRALQSVPICLASGWTSSHSPRKAVAQEWDGVPPRPSVTPGRVKGTLRPDH